MHGGHARDGLLGGAEGAEAVGAVEAARDLRGVPCGHRLAHAPHLHAARRRSPARHQWSSARYP